jgi:hypothetical protein
MGELSAYAVPVNAEKLAKRLAIDYVGARLEATVGGAVSTQMKTYIVGARAHTPPTMVDLGANLYQSPPISLRPLPTPSPAPSRGWRALLKKKRRPELGGSLPHALPKAALAYETFGTPAPTQIFLRAMATPATAWPRYEPMGKWMILWSGAPLGRMVEQNAGQVLRTIAANLVEVQRRASGEAEEIDRYVDEGLNRPPARRVRTLHARLAPAGPGTPRVAYDPDRE